MLAYNREKEYNNDMSEVDKGTKEGPKAVFLAAFRSLKTETADTLMKSPPVSEILGGAGLVLYGTLLTILFKEAHLDLSLLVTEPTAIAGAGLMALGIVRAALELRRGS
jgi:hypothetical protein